MSTKMKTIDISRKDKYGNVKKTQYVPVNERVKAFRSEKQFEGWRIETEAVTLNEDFCIMRCTILDKDGNLRATGWAREVRDDALSLVNKTSYVENCETSAVGRALGFMGIGIDDSICSAEELLYAMQTKEQMNNYTPNTKEPSKSQENAQKKHLYNELTERERDEYDAICAQCDFAQDKATLGRIYNMYRDAAFEPMVAEKCAEVCKQHGWETKEGK